MVRTAGPLAGLFVGGILAAGGFLLAFWIGKPMREQARASESWPTTEGRITRSEVIRSVRDGTPMYTADITYTYELDGKMLDGDRVWFGDGYRSSSNADWRRVVARYPVGARVRVHYDPAAPDTSVLEPGTTWSGSILYVLGLGMMAVGGFILLACVTPLLIVVAALAGSLGPRQGDEMRDFDRRPPRPSGDDRPRPATPGSSDDDGISIV